jgi:hypothetical protein
MSKRQKSTSSGPLRGVRRFSSDECEERYEALVRRTIQAERLVNFAPNGKYSKIVQLIEDRKWHKLCELEREINYDIVREFYANAIQVEEGRAYHYKTQVRGKVIIFNRDALNNFLGNPLTLREGERCQYREKMATQEWDFNEVNEQLFLQGRSYLLNDQGLPKHWKREDLTLEA